MSQRVVIVDRHRLFADCLCIALTTGGHRCRVKVPHAWSTVIQMVKAIEREHPDVVVVNANPGLAWDGLELVRPVRDSGAEVVVVTEDSDPTRCREALRRGARSVLPKRSSLASFQTVIGQIALGEDPLPGGAWTIEAMEQPLGEDASRAHLQRLTGRENEILGRLMAGQTVSEIARADVVSEATVRTQVRSILTKLEVSSQLAAVSVARRAGWPGQRGPAHTASV